MKHIGLSCSLWLLFLVSAAAQQQPVRPATPPPGATVPASGGDLNSILNQLEQAAQTTSLDLAHLRIEKWKGERSVKEDAKSKADSLENNLTAALPSMISAARSAPDTLAPALKLYRNMNVVYDVLVTVTESAGAFGNKDEFRALASDTDAIDTARRALADFLEARAAAQDAELARARTQARPAADTGVKKIVIDDTEPAPKKPTRKKKPASPPPKPATPPPTPAPNPQ